MAIALAFPAPAAVMTWAVGVTTFPAAHTPGTLVWPKPSTITNPVVLSRWHPRASRIWSLGRGCGAMKAASHSIVCAVVKDDPVEESGLARKVRYQADDHGDPERLQTVTVLGGEIDSIGDERNSVTVAAQQAGLFDRHLFRVAADHHEVLVAYLVSVAVRTVVDEGAPTFPEAGDVGQLVGEAGGDEHRSRINRGTALKSERCVGCDSYILQVVGDD